MVGLKKKEDVFFGLFKESAAKILEAGEAFAELVHDYTDVEDKVSRLKVLETECDIQTHKLLRHLNSSFITPFDREDIYNIAREMDDIVDAIEEVANSFTTFDIKEMRPEALTMATLILQAVRELETLFMHLHEIKTGSIVMEQVIEVNRIENEGDIVFRSTMKKLFREADDAIELIKWKQLYEQLEDALDSCEKVANLIEGAVMKYA